MIQQSPGAQSLDKIEVHNFDSPAMPTIFENLTLQSNEEDVKEMTSKLSGTCENVQAEKVHVLHVQSVSKVRDCPET